MFPQSLRFDLRHDRNFFKSASRKSFPLFQVFFESAGRTQFAVVVPKKVSKKATDRHKILRRMRHILAANQESFPKKKIVFVLFYRSLDTSYQELERMVKEAASRVK